MALIIPRQYDVLHLTEEMLAHNNFIKVQTVQVFAKNSQEDQAAMRYVKYATDALDPENSNAC